MSYDGHHATMAARRNHCTKRNCHHPKKVTVARVLATSKAIGSSRGNVVCEVAAATLVIRRSPELPHAFNYKL